MFLESLLKLQECDFVLFHCTPYFSEWGISLQLCELTWILSSVAATHLDVSTNMLPLLQWCAWIMTPFILSPKCSRLVSYRSHDLLHHLHSFIPLPLLLCFALTVQLHKIENALSVKCWNTKIFCGNYILDLEEFIPEGYFRDKLSSQGWGKEERGKTIL